jgi:hypothetical protein
MLWGQRSGNSCGYVSLLSLAMLFNLLELHEPRRYTVYLMLINFCGATKQIGALAAQQEAQVHARLRLSDSVSAIETRVDAVGIDPPHRHWPVL